MKRTLIRIAAVLVLILVALVLYDTGKMHTLLPENKTVDLGSAHYTAYTVIVFSIDGQEPVELYPRDRVKAEVKGRSHRITVTGTARNGSETTVETRFRIHHRQDMYLLSLPALLGEDPGWLQEFTPLN